jgi:alpha-ketoglutarate-dependent taurine dioxygenase
MSPSFRAYLETLNATHDASFFHAEAAQHGIKIDKNRERGNPLNTGDHLTASHPLIRTNRMFVHKDRKIKLTSLAVTGWKAMYVNKGFFGRIDGVSRDESDIIAKYCFDLINNNMDIQCRFRWEAGSIAIWDNRCTWHSGMSFLPSIGPITDCTALFDYNEERAGDRASSIGEKPYLDPNSQYKSEALKAEGKKW